MVVGYACFQDPPQVNFDQYHRSDLIAFSHRLLDCIWLSQSVCVSLRLLVAPSHNVKLVEERYWIRFRQSGSCPCWSECPGTWTTSHQEPCVDCHHRHYEGRALQSCPAAPTWGPLFRAPFNTVASLVNMLRSLVHGSRRLVSWRFCTSRGPDVWLWRLLRLVSVFAVCSH